MRTDKDLSRREIDEAEEFRSATLSAVDAGALKGSADDVAAFRAAFASASPMTILRLQSRVGDALVDFYRPLGFKLVGADIVRKPDHKASDWYRY